MKKYLSFLILVFILITPLFAFADGGIFIESRPDSSIQETRQRAAIFYENGVETLILSTNFKGTAKDFGWVIPTPSKPEVSKASMDLFQKLETITQHSYQSYYGGIKLGDAGSSYRAAEKTPYVAVIETKKIDYYNIDILESNDADALSKWLAEHKYHFPEKERYILNDYIQNGWYFTAVKVDTSAQGSGRVNLALEEGHATPLKLVFKTPNIVFPLKISSIKSEPQELQGDTLQTGITFEDGVKGKAVTLSKNFYLLGTINAGTLALDDFTLSFWFKTDPAIVDNIYQLFSISSGRNKWDYRLAVNFIGPGVSVNVNGNIWGTEAGAKIKDALTNGWNHIEVQINAGFIPKLRLNSIQFNLIDLQRAAIMKGVSTPVLINQGDSLTIGDTTNRWQNSKPISFDEVKITRNDIAELSPPCPLNECPPGVDCIQSCPVPSPIDQNVLKIYFSNDLLFYVINYENGNAYVEGYLTPNNKQPLPKTTQNSVTLENRAVPIELYILANHRQTLSSFQIPYAGWMRKKTIEELGVDTNGGPLIQPAGKKYFLTKLTRTMKQEEMTEDIFPKQSPNDDLINARDLPLVDTSGAVVWFVVGSVVLSTALLGLLVWWSFRKKL